MTSYSGIRQRSTDDTLRVDLSQPLLANALPKYPLQRLAGAVPMQCTQVQVVEANVPLGWISTWNTVPDITSSSLTLQIRALIKQSALSGEVPGDSVCTALSGDNCPVVMPAKCPLQCAKKYRTLCESHTGMSSWYSWSHCEILPLDPSMKSDTPVCLILLFHDLPKDMAHVLRRGEFYLRSRYFLVSCFLSSRYGYGLHY